MTGVVGGDCGNEADCQPGFVCVDGECGDAWAHTFEMRVLAFSPPTCVEVAGDVDPDYRVWRGDSLLTDSPEDACPASWPATVTTIAPFLLGPAGFVIEFRDNDLVTAPEHLCTWAWDTLGTGQAGPVHRPWLADGGWAGTFDNGCYAELEFALVE